MGLFAPSSPLSRRKFLWQLTHDLNSVPEATSVSAKAAESCALWEHHPPAVSTIASSAEVPVACLRSTSKARRQGHTSMAPPRY
jgi:hypothetical protein